MNNSTEIGCGSLDGFAELSKSILDGFDNKLREFPPDRCAPFHDAARDLVVELMTFYRMMAICAKRQEDVDATVVIWGFMQNVCDRFLSRMVALCKEHPSCGAEIYHDRILDLRNKCHRMAVLHSKD